MDTVRNASNSECYTQSSEPFGVDKCSERFYTTISVLQQRPRGYWNTRDSHHAHWDFVWKWTLLRTGTTTLQYILLPFTWRFRISSSWSPVTNTCLMNGSLLRATSPMPALSVGTVRQHSTWNRHVQQQMYAGIHRTRQASCRPRLHKLGEGGEIIFQRNRK
jgi:hypothetical protein